MSGVVFVFLFLVLIVAALLLQWYLDHGLGEEITAITTLNLNKSLEHYSENAWGALHDTVVSKISSAPAMTLAEAGALKQKYGESVANPCEKHQSWQTQFDVLLAQYSPSPAIVEHYADHHDPYVRIFAYGNIHATSLVKQLEECDEDYQARRAEGEWESVFSESSVPTRERWSVMDRAGSGARSRARSAQAKYAMQENPS